ncbi:unnamed protein product [Sphagnum troendelagicum]
MANTKQLPAGLRLLKRLRGKDLNFNAYRTSVLIITFISYAFYHMSRKPPSIAKTVLDPEDNMQSAATLQGRGWPPFDGKTGKARLGEVDVAFLASYAIGMYFAGHLGDRLHLRLFLTVGMMVSGLFVCLFGLGYWLDIHYLSYFITVQVFAGLFQATGWPSVVTIVGNWFGKSRRGLIMGIWNAHTSVGNILGSLIAAAVLKYGWGWSFLLPGILMACGGLMIFLFLVVEPADVGLPSPHAQNPAEGHQDNQKEEEWLLDVKKAEKKQAAPLSSEMEPAIGFFEAWRIPGVATFAFCLFFSKLVAYTFLYWLPFYIRHTRIAGEFLDDKMAGNLSTLFDVGGVVGGIVAGYVSDHLKARAITAASFMFSVIPALYFYRLYGGISLPVNIGLMMLAGMLINGPYALITTAVSADLGTHRSIRANGKALATVTAIIDGTGSVGAAIGPLLTGYISSQGWGAVFKMLMVAAFCAGILLTKLVIAEFAEKFGKKPIMPCVEGEVKGNPNEGQWWLWVVVDKK